MNRGCDLGLVALAVSGMSCAPAFVPPPPSPQRVYGLSEVDERPEIVLAPPLHYPDDPRLVGVDGSVVVRLVVDTAGNPEPATVHVVAAPDSTAAAVEVFHSSNRRPQRNRGASDRRPRDEGRARE